MFNPEETEKRYQAVYNAIKSRMPREMLDRDEHPPDGISQPFVNYYIIARLDGATHEEALAVVEAGAEAQKSMWKEAAAQGTREAIERAEKHIQSFRAMGQHKRADILAAEVEKMKVRGREQIYECGCPQPGYQRGQACALERKTLCTCSCHATPRATGVEPA